MVKIVNIFKAAGVWVGAIFLLYGNREVASTVARAHYGGFGTALAPTRSPERGEVVYGQEHAGSLSFSRGGMEMQQDVGSLRTRSAPVRGGGTAGGGRQIKSMF